MSQALRFPGKRSPVLRIGLTSRGMADLLRLQVVAFEANLRNLAIVEAYFGIRPR
jgi:hypothetical protein